MRWSLDSFEEFLNFSNVKDVIAFGQCDVDRVLNLWHVCEIFITDILHNAESAGVVRAFELQIILIVPEEEGPVSQGLGGEGALLGRIFRLFCQFGLIFLCPMVRLDSEIRNDEDLASKRWQRFLM